MRPVGLFAAATLVLIALAAWAFTFVYESPDAARAIWTSAVIAFVVQIITFVYESPDAARAIWTSAAVAFVVQIITFAVVKLSAKTNVIAGWGIGAIMRFAVLGVYALVFVKALGLPSGAALISMAAFFFISTLIEPLLLQS